MRKGVLKALTFMCAAGVWLSGCGKEKEEENVDKLQGSAVEVAYRGVEYEPYDTTVTEEEIQKRLDSFVSSHAVYSEVTDRDDVRDGDTVNIDYTGYMDGEAFSGGSDTDFDLTIGSGQFIDGFESGLIGAKNGSTVDVKATFPDPYKNNPDFSGKEAVFTVKINAIKVKEETGLTDELVAANTDYTTVADYKAYLESSLKTQKESYAESYKKSVVLTNLIDKTEFTGIAQEDIDSYYNSSYEYYKNLAQIYETNYGYSFSMFIEAFFGCSSEEEYEALLKEQAEREVKRTLILYYIIEKEKITVSGEEYDEALQRYAKDYNTTVEEFTAQVEESKIKQLVKQEKAEQLIYDNAAAKKIEKK